MCAQREARLLVSPARGSIADIAHANWKGRYMLKVVLMALAFSLSVSQPVFAESLDAITLQSLCDDPSPESEASAMCFTYVLGSYEGMMYGAGITLSRLSNGDMPTNEVNALTQSFLGFCLGSAGSNEEIVSKVGAGLTMHPDLQSLSARGAVLWALRVAYPCD